MPEALKSTDTTVGKKAVMAVSGAILVGFLVGHLLGNLNLYLGADALNNYAATLRGLPALIWGTRFLLLFAIGAHIWSAFHLWKRNRGARRTRYKMRKNLTTDYAARTMYFSGPILLAYIVYHLWHFTIAPEHGHDVYRNVVEGFQNPLIAAIYIIGNLALGFHLFHGVFSAFQSIGANHPRYNALRRLAATGLAGLITIGNVSFPIMVLLGKVSN